MSNLEVSANNNQIQQNNANSIQKPPTFSTEFENTTDNPPSYEDALLHSIPVDKYFTYLISNGENHQLPLLNVPELLNSGLSDGNNSNNVFSDWRRTQSLVTRPQFCSNSELIPTVEMDVNQNALLCKNNQNITSVEDGLKIKKCFKLLSFDYKQFGDIFLNKTIKQRQQIFQTYKREFGKDLHNQLATKTKGNVQYLFLSLLYPLSYAEAYWLHDIMASKLIQLGSRVNTNAINEILGTKTKDQLKSIVSAYFQLNQITLASSINTLTEKEYRKFLIFLCSDSRTINDKLDNDSINVAVMKIQSTKIGKSNKGKSSLIEIFAHSSEMRLKEIALAFERKFNTSLIEHLKKVTGGSLQKMFVLKISYCTNPILYHCKCLNLAVKYKDVKTLIKFIVSREAVDLSKIIVEYKSIYGNILQDDIKHKFKSYSALALCNLLDKHTQKNEEVLPNWSMMHRNQ